MGFLEVLKKILVFIILFGGNQAEAEIASIKVGSRFYSVLLENNSKMFMSHSWGLKPEEVDILESPKVWIFADIDRYIDQYISKQKPRENIEAERAALKQKAFDYAIEKKSSDEARRIVELRESLSSVRDKWEAQYNAHQLALNARTQDQKTLAEVESLVTKLDKLSATEKDPEISTAKSYYVNLGSQLNLKIADTQTYHQRISQTYRQNKDLSAKFKTLEARVKNEETKLVRSITSMPDSINNPFVLKIKELENSSHSIEGLGQDCDDFLSDPQSATGFTKIRLIEKCMQNELVGFVVMRSPPPVQNPYYQGSSSTSSVASNESNKDLHRDSRRNVLSQPETIEDGRYVKNGNNWELADRYEPEVPRTETRDRTMDVVKETLKYNERAIQQYPSQPKFKVITVYRNGVEVKVPVREGSSIPAGSYKLMPQIRESAPAPAPPDEPRD